LRDFYDLNQLFLIAFKNHFDTFSAVLFELFNW